MKSPILDHEKQLEVFKDPARFKVVVAGRRFGKSILGAEWLIEGLDVKCSQNVYTAPTRTDAKEIIWEYFKMRMDQLKWSCKINESELKIIRRSKRSRLYLKSAEKENMHRGRGNDRYVLDEYSEYKGCSLWTQAIRPSLSDRLGKAMFLFTPKGFNHAYDIYNEAKTSKDWKCFSFKTIDSPFFQTKEGKQELADARASLTDKDYKQEYEASFETYMGRIYHAFNRDTCHEPYEYNPDLPIIVGQDFNRSPMASALYQEVNGRYFQFGEIFDKIGNTKQTCEKIREKYDHNRVIFNPDATGNRKTSNSSKSDFDIIKSFNFYIETEKINPRRVDRWASVNAAYENGLVKVNVKNCPVTTKDRENLCYREGSCEPDTRDPMAGHMSDAADYPIARRFPICITRKTTIEKYA